MPATKVCRIRQNRTRRHFINDDANVFVVTGRKELAGWILRDRLAAFHRRLLFASLMVLCMTGTARGQTDTTKTDQLWLDYNPIWQINKRWILDLDNGSRFVFSDPSLWQLRFQPTLEFSSRKWMDLTGGVWLIYTNQFDASDFFETRPTLGIRLKHDIWRGIRLSNYTRAEYRIQTNLSDRETMAAGRLRNRIQALIPINQRSLSVDNTWYVLVDSERFWQRDENVDDGFLSRQRFRAGIAWRKNSTSTFELLYVYQRSINPATESFSVFDDILSFRVVHNFN